MTSFWLLFLSRPNFYLKEIWETSGLCETKRISREPDIPPRPPLLAYRELKRKGQTWMDLRALDSLKTKSKWNSTYGRRADIPLEIWKQETYCTYAFVFSGLGLSNKIHKQQQWYLYLEWEWLWVCFSVSSNTADDNARPLFVFLGSYHAFNHDRCNQNTPSRKERMCLFKERALSCH